MSAPAPIAIIGRGADLSLCGTYRYELTRVWDRSRGSCAFVMLNPSTADATVDDATIRRCIRFAADWGFGILKVYNLFGLRARRPKDLEVHADPFGPELDRWYRRAVECDRVVCAWGSFLTGGAFADRGQVVARAHLKRADLYCLEVNGDGNPRHPLYVRSDAELKPWRPA